MTAFEKDPKHVPTLVSLGQMYMAEHNHDVMPFDAFDILDTSNLYTLNLHIWILSLWFHL